jgi:3-oxoacyl-[acyl-carrier-protein] synthase-3
MSSQVSHPRHAAPRCRASRAQHRSRRAWSTHPTSGSCSVRASASAIWHRPDETTASLGEAAARDALAAGLTPADIDLIVLATSTPNNTFPATAVEIQNRLGITHGFAYRHAGGLLRVRLRDLATADLHLRGGNVKRALVIGAETFSRILDWNDRSTCVLFGDGAGAVVLEAVEGEGAIADRGILAASLRSDGSHREKLYVDGGPSTTGTVGHPAHGRPRGLQARRRHDHRRDRGRLRADRHHAAKTSTGSCRTRRTSASSTRPPRSSASADEKVVITVDRHGNTSAASMPLALHTAVSDGRIKPGDLVLIEAMGGGFTWGAVLVRW